MPHGKSPTTPHHNKLFGAHWRWLHVSALPETAPNGRPVWMKRTLNMGRNAAKRAFRALHGVRK